MEEEEKDDFDGDGSVVGFSGSFWDAVVAKAIPKPELVNWNKWQQWRSTDGGGPKGPRGRPEQQREAKLWRAAMKEYYGEDWQDVLRTGKTSIGADRLALGQEVRELFPDVRCTTVGSGDAAAPKSSSLLRRAATLLVDLESYESHYDRISRLCTIGSQMYPDTFTPEVVRVAKVKVNLLRSAYETIASCPDDDVPPGRDHPDVGATLAEAFLVRFEQETDSELFTPGVRAVFDAYDELLAYYEKPSGSQLLQMSREASVRTREEDLPEVRRQSRPVAAAPPAPRGPVRTGEPNSRNSGPDAPARGGESGRAGGPEGVSDAPAQSGRDAAALGRASERASGPQVFGQVFKRRPLEHRRSLESQCGRSGPCRPRNCAWEAVGRRRSPRPVRRKR